MTPKRSRAKAAVEARLSRARQSLAPQLEQPQDWLPAAQLRQQQVRSVPQVLEQPNSA